MIADNVKQILFVGEVEEAKKYYSSWFLIKQVGLMFVGGKYVPVLQVLVSSLKGELIDRLYGRRVFTWVSQN